MTASDSRMAMMTTTAIISVRVKPRRALLDTGAKALISVPPLALLAQAEAQDVVGIHVRLVRPARQDVRLVVVIPERVFRVEVDGRVVESREDVTENLQRLITVGVHRPRNGSGAA